MLKQFKVAVVPHYFIEHEKDEGSEGRFSMYLEGDTNPCDVGLFSSKEGTKEGC